MMKMTFQISEHLYENIPLHEVWNVMFCLSLIFSLKSTLNFVLKIYEIIQDGELNFIPKFSMKSE